MNKQLNIGESLSIKHTFTQEDVALFATLSTDKNPVHLDENYARETQFKGRIVHGMLVGSLFSGILGTKLPGEGSIYLGQDLMFKLPVFFDMEVTATVEVVAIHESKPIVTLKTTCCDNEGKTLIDGEAVVYVPDLMS